MIGCHVAFPHIAHRGISDKSVPNDKGFHWPEITILLNHKRAAVERSIRPDPVIDKQCGRGYRYYAIGRVRIKYAAQVERVGVNKVECG